MSESTVWIKDFLEAAEQNPTEETIHLIECCGRSCALRKGHVDSMSKLKAAASWCKTRSDYTLFLKEHISEAVTEDDDGIRIPLGKKKCTCPLAEDIQSSMLCCCTQGSNRATWSEFFGRDVKVEMVETFMRGGNDCVIKLYI